MKTSSPVPAFSQVCHRPGYWRRRTGLRAVALDPESSFALGALGGVQIARGEYAEARQTFEKLTKLDPSEPTGWNSLPAALLGLKDIRGAREAAKREAQESQKSRESHAFSGAF